MLRRTSGLALLHQDPWECLISFIVSAFNNIPKVELSLDRLAQQFGEQIGERTWTFPTAEPLAEAGLRDLRRCALGYRAPYVRDVARLVAAGDLDLPALGRVEYLSARRMLLALPGVGEKVADCVLLFAYGKGEAFPVDVWVKRAVERWYFSGRRKTEREIREFAHQRFGSLAGYAQQHLFHYMRERGKA
jgi:N-glycosylase/DNA lyase